MGVVGLAIDTEAHYNTSLISIVENVVPLLLEAFPGESFLSAY